MDRLASRQEKEEKDRILVENDSFLAFCPFVSRFPFEIWIIPQTHQSSFTEITPREISTLAQVMRDVLARMKKVLNDPPYNFIIHTTPIDGEEHPGYHWHMEIMPRVSRIAGLEWGTGLYTVDTPPEVAIRYLKEVKL